MGRVTFVRFVDLQEEVRVVRADVRGLLTGIPGVFHCSYARRSDTGNFRSLMAFDVQRIYECSKTAIDVCNNIYLWSIILEGCPYSLQDQYILLFLKLCKWCTMIIIILINQLSCT